MSSKKWLTAVIFPALFFVNFARAEEPSAGSIRPDDSDSQRIVVFKKGVSMADARQIAQQAGNKVVRDLELINAVVIRSPKVMIESVDARLFATGEVLRIDEDTHRTWINDAVAAPDFDDTVNAVIEKFTPMKAPARPQPAGNELPWGIKKVKAPEAWPTTRGAKVKVAVVDTGIDMDHPNLVANVKGGTNASMPIPVPVPTPPEDDHGHGTHVSGTIAAAAIQAQGSVIGVAPEAELYAVKVLDGQGRGYLSGIISGIEWCVKNNMNVLNMSLGGPDDNQSFHDAITAAYKAGVAIVAAAGNDSGGPVAYPAAYTETIAVSASTLEDDFAYFSSKGPQVDFIAPGHKVYSTLKDGKYGTYSGTSMACPHVTGLAALAIARYGVRGTDAVREALRPAAAKLPKLTSDQQGNGLIDAYKLVTGSSL